MINSLHSKLFLLNKTSANKSDTDHQIYIGNETFFNKYNLSNLKSNNMIIINQGDVSRNINNNKINEDDINLLRKNIPENMVSQNLIRA